MKHAKEPQLTSIELHHIQHEMLTLATRYEAKIFFETGTHLGNTTIAMAKFKYFDEIHTIEISDAFIKLSRKAIYEIGAKHFRLDVSNIKLWYGDTAQCMPGILKNINERCIFWLDAHYDGNVTGKSDLGECPLVHELNAIKDHPIKDHVIVIDDIRHSVRDNKEGWPNISEIIHLIELINSNYCITIKYGTLFAEVPQSAFRVDLNEQRVMVYDLDDFEEGFYPWEILAGTTKE